MSNCYYLLLHHLCPRFYNSSVCHCVICCHTPLSPMMYVVCLIVVVNLNFSLRFSPGGYVDYFLIQYCTKSIFGDLLTFLLIIRRVLSSILMLTRESFPLRFSCWSTPPPRTPWPMTWKRSSARLSTTTPQRP